MERYMNHRMTHIFINAVIFFNAVVLGLMTRQDITQSQMSCLERLDDICLGIFCIEISLRILMEKRQFFREGWNCFDITVIGIAIVSSMGVFSIGRAFRVFKLLKLVSHFPSLRLVTLTVLNSLSQMGGIVVFLFVICYVFAILGNQLFGEAFPDFFGSFSASMFTLFQIMTLDAWSDQVARPMLAVYPFSWMYFLAFIFLSTIVALNVVVGLIVETVNHLTKYDRIRRFEEAMEDKDELLREIAELQLHLEKMNQILTKKRGDEHD